MSIHVVVFEMERIPVVLILWCLRDFNLAMLSKQGWRLLFRHDSMVGKVFKARYYPQGDYLSAELGSNPSFIWSSIFVATDIVKAGLRKRIGAGLTVQITTDPWLPTSDRATPILVVQGLENFSVNCLFQANSRSWDVEVVRDLFSPEDAAIILGIPLNSGDADTWYWVAEKKCFYSVRSAYNLLQSLKHSSVFSENNEIWKKLWSLKVPPKAKDLVWRAASNCLATKVNLCTKKILVENTCPLCGVFAETEWHILVSCNFPWSCWEFAGLAAASREVSSLGQWLADMFRLLQGDSQARAVMLCWAIWCARNDLIWQQRSRSVKDVVTFANVSPDQWLKAQGKGNIPLLSPLKDGDGSELWVKPSADGILVAAFAGVKHGKVSPDLAEIMGIREALSWLKNHTYTQATVETDSLVCAEATRNAEVFVSSFGSVVEDCKKILDSLINVSLLFVKCSSNCTAHFVARHSISLAELMDYLTRLLTQASHAKGFRFHAMCKSFELVNLCFEDNLIMFCKGYVRSLRLVHGAFMEFCATTRLFANYGKSFIYFGGINDDCKNELLSISKIETGTILLKYMGVHLHPTKWRATNCEGISEKIRRKLHGWSSRHLSFASRAQLIHSVLLSF
uniref:Reverse transcriptase zinc-binding domain-containing protein n=1 Tax=Cannabis sativa TaxID=3483 RepID=A0A803PRX8_CANSA